MHKLPLLLTVALCALITTGSRAAAAPDDTSRWLTDSNTGVNVWNPAPVAGESVAWLGADREATGPGVAIWKVGEQETEQAAGDWKGGRLDGHGVWQHSGGERYEGQWKNGRKHGHGVYTWADGKRFCGRYRDGNRQEGAFYDADGKMFKSMTPSPADRQQAFEAEAAAIRARQVAGDARRRTNRTMP